MMLRLKHPLNQLKLLLNQLLKLLQNLLLMLKLQNQPQPRLRRLLLKRKPRRMLYLPKLKRRLLKIKNWQ